MSFSKSLRRFTTDAAGIDARLRARPTLFESFALVLALSLVGAFTWAYLQWQVQPFDYAVYSRAARGDPGQYFYAEWILPLHWLVSLLPFPLGYIVWSVAGILCLFFAARVFGGHPALVLLVFQTFYVVFLGQITGILIGGLALSWWGMAHRRWHIAGLGLLIAAAKFQIGVAFGLLLLLAADISWRERLRVLLLPAVGAVLSLLFRPAWPLDLLARIQAHPPYDWASISLWRWIGPSALLLWLPPLLLPLARRDRLIALAAACPLALPYFQQADLLTLFVLPVGWLPVLLGNLGYLFFAFRFEALQLLGVVPLIVYSAVVLPSVAKLLSRR